MSRMPDYLRTLFLHPPSFRGLRRRGGLALPGAARGALVLVSDLAGPARGAGPGQPAGRRAAGRPGARATCMPLARDYELAVLHTSTPSFAHDVRVAEALQAANPTLRVGFVGAHVAVQREQALAASPAIDFVGRRRVRLHDPGDRAGAAAATAWPGCPTAPTVTSTRTPERGRARGHGRAAVRGGRLPPGPRGRAATSSATCCTRTSRSTPGRGCRSKCTFCLWPQTVGGHRYRTRSVEHVVAEIAHATPAVPPGEGVLLRRRHVHRRPAAGRGDRARARPARRHLVLQRQGRTCPTRR